MLTEDDNPLHETTSSRAVHKNLDPMSVRELEAYVQDLQAEITRVQSEIVKKSSSRAAAEAFFAK